MGARRDSQLSTIRPPRWPSRYTSELVELINVLTLVVELEPEQATLLDDVVEGPQVSVDDLVDAQLSPVTAAARKPIRLQRPQQSRLEV